MEDTIPMMGKTMQSLKEKETTEKHYSAFTMMDSSVNMKNTPSRFTNGRNIYTVMRRSAHITDILEQAEITRELSLQFDSKYSYRRNGK